MKRSTATVFSLLLLLAAGPSRAAGTRVLVIWPTPGAAETSPDWALQGLRRTLGHFDCTVTEIASDAYRGGEIDEHQAVIYLGIRPEAELPEALLADLKETDRSVCWLGWAPPRNHPLDRYGFHLSGLAPAADYQWVSYRGQHLNRPPISLAHIVVTDPTLCESLAVAEGNGSPVPYAVRSGRFWFFADLPLLEVDELGHFLVLCDQLHDILDQKHASRRTAFLAITGVTPGSDPPKLRELTGYLRDVSVPFAISVLPFTAYPEGGTEDRLTSRSALARVLRAAQGEGAAILVQMPSDQGPTLSEREEGGGTAEGPLGQFEAAAAALAKCGLFPLGVTTAGGPLDGETSGRCSTVWERRLAAAPPPALPALPFLRMSHDGPRQVIPDNLSALSGEATTPEPVLEQVRLLNVVSDPWASIALDPEAPIQAVQPLLAALRDMDYRFADLRRMANHLKTDSLQVASAAAPAPLTDLTPEGWNATLVGPGPQEMKRFERPPRDGRREALLRPGAILIAYPPGVRAARSFALGGSPHESAQRLVATIARLAVFFAVCASVVLVIIYLVQVSLQRRT